MRNVLAAENQIRSGFYDVGSSGSNSEHLGGFPTLEALLSSPIDKKREIVWVNCEKDADLEKLIATIVREVQDTVQPNQSATSGAYPSFARVTALRIIAKRVAEHMGGVRAQQAGKNSDDFGYKFHIAEMKVTRGSNVLPLGCIRQGTFYHRALAFKVIADLLLHTDERKRPSSGKPAVGTNFVDVPVFSEMRALGTRVALTRGEYGRAWNSVQLKPYEVLDADSFKATAGNLGVLAAKEEEYVVDLMFQPGALIKSTSVEAEAYRRISE